MVGTIVRVTKDKLRGLVVVKNTLPNGLISKRAGWLDSAKRLILNKDYEIPSLATVQPPVLVVNTDEAGKQTVTKHYADWQF